MDAHKFLTSPDGDDVAICGLRLQSLQSFFVLRTALFRTFGRTHVDQRLRASTSIVREIGVRPVVEGDNRLPVEKSGENEIGPHTKAERPTNPDRLIAFHLRRNPNTG